MALVFCAMLRNWLIGHWVVSGLDRCLVAISDKEHGQGKGYAYGYDFPVHYLASSALNRAFASSTMSAGVL
jgi:hypothetical protein